MPQPPPSVRSLHALRPVSTAEVADAEVWSHTAALVTVLDVAGDELLWAAMTPAQERALGVSFAALRGRAVRARSELPFEEWLHAHGPACAVVGERTSFEPELPENGRWLSRTVTPVVDAGGRVRRLVVDDVDVSESRQLAALLAQAARMDAVGRAAGEAAREFNGLLVALSGHAGLALKAAGAEGRGRAHLEELLRLAESASSLTRQVLAASHRQRAAPALVRVDELVAGMERVLRRLVRDGVAVTVRGAPEPWPVKVDPRQLEQVLVHLAAHAREAMPRGGALSFEVDNATLSRDEAHRLGLSPGDHVVLTARDTGDPIDPRDLQRMFDPQAAAASRSDAALGLATCHGVIRQHGGAITVASAPGQGTAFRVYLPRSAEKAASSGVALASGALRGHETVLAVGAGDAVARTLRMLGYAVLEAATPADALRAVEGHGRAPIDLAVLGGAPADGALAVLRALAARGDRATVLALDAAGERAAAEAGLRAAALPAGSAPTALARRVREALDAAR